MTLTVPFRAPLPRDPPRRPISSLPGRLRIPRAQPPVKLYTKSPDSRLLQLVIPQFPPGELALPEYQQIRAPSPHRRPSADPLPRLGIGMILMPEVREHLRIKT